MTSLPFMNQAQQWWLHQVEQSPLWSQLAALLEGCYLRPRPFFTEALKAPCVKPLPQGAWRSMLALLQHAPLLVTLVAVACLFVELKPVLLGQEALGHYMQGVLGHLAATVWRVALWPLAVGLLASLRYWVCGESRFFSLLQVSGYALLPTLLLPAVGALATGMPLLADVLVWGLSLWVFALQLLALATVWELKPPQLWMLLGLPSLLLALWVLSVALPWKLLVLPLFGA